MNGFRAVAAAILLAGCGGEDPVARIDDFSERSPLVECAELGRTIDELASVATFQPVDDSTFLVVDEVGRRTYVVGDDARVRRARSFSDQGPGGVGQLMDAVLLGDTILVVADGERNRLIAFASGDEPHWVSELAYPPQRLVFTGERLLIAAVGMDPRIPGLVHERTADGSAPVGVPFAHHADALARMFINSVSMVSFGDGSALVAHELVWPRAWHVGRSGAPRPAQVPVPDAAAGSVGVMPPMPLRSEDLGKIAAPVVSMTVDPRRSELHYLTRSGRTTAPHLEKAIVRVSRDLRYLASYRLRINATEIAYLPARPDSVIVVDADFRWHRCPLPPIPRNGAS